MARVVVNVRVRDLTGNDLNRLNRSFNRLGDSVNRFAGQRTQRNLNNVRGSVTHLGDELNRLRGRIPEREFARLSSNFQRLQTLSNNIRTNSSNRHLGLLRNSLSGLTDEITRLNRVPTPHIRPNVVPPDRNRVRRTILNSLLSPFKLIGGVLGGTLSDGVGQGLSNGLKAAGPIIGTAFLAAVAGAIALVGAAIAGALVLAIGTAFVGLGGFLAFQADGVKKKWAKTLADLKPLFIDAAEPMAPVLEHLRKLAGEIGKDFAPHFKQALAAAAPHFQTFLDHIINGFKELGKRAAPDLEEAFNVFLDAFGPEVEATLGGLGDSLAALARTVRDHSTEIAWALGLIIGAITILVDAVNFLANAWVWAIHSMYDAVGTLLGGVANLLDVILSCFAGILTGADKAFGWIPGVGDKLDGARANFDTWRDQVVGDMRSASDSFKGAGAELDRTNRLRILKVNIESWKSQLRTARADLKKTSDQKAKAKIQANIDDLTNKLRQANGQLNALNGKTVTTFVRTAYYQGAAGPYAPLRAAGGGIGLSTAATGGARSNMTLVGEQGPELVNLAPGSRVRSNPDTRRIMGAAGGTGGGGSSTIIIDSSDDPVDRLLLQILRKAVRVQGGNAQIVFGGRQRQ